MTSAYLTAWLRAFVVTELVEAPIYRYGYGARWSHAFGASAITHPIVWFVFFGPIGEQITATYETRLVLAELFAWLVEAAFLRMVSQHEHALAWAFTANAASVAVGWALREAFGFP